MNNVYEIEIVVYIDIDKTLEVTISGNDLISLKNDILPTVKKMCEENGYTNGEVTVEVTMSKNGSYYDHDEDDFELSEI